MKYNRLHGTAAWGMMAKDWEQGLTIIAVRRPSEASSEAIRYAGLGGVLC
jgi:hypothetical protein